MTSPKLRDWRLSTPIAWRSIITTLMTSSSSRMREHFSDEQILELGMMIGQFIGFGRLLMVLDLESKFCPVEPASE